MPVCRLTFIKTRNDFNWNSVISRYKIWLMNAPGQTKWNHRGLLSWCVFYKSGSYRTFICASCAKFLTKKNIWFGLVIIEHLAFKWLSVIIFNEIRFIKFKCGSMPSHKYTHLIAKLFSWILNASFFWRNLTFLYIRN